MERTVKLPVWSKEIERVKELLKQEMEDWL